MPTFVNFLFVLFTLHSFATAHSRAVNRDYPYY